MQNLRLLLWLKWKLTLRGFQRNASQGVGAALMLLIFLPASIAIGVLCYLGFISPMSLNNQTHLLFMAFLGIYVLWLAAPLFGYAFNDTYDITRLFHYPVPMRRIFLAVVCGSLLDLPTLFLLPTLIAAFFGFTTSMGSAVLNLLALTLFLLHTFTLSQALILISSRILKSRRFRDGMMLLISLLAMLYFISPLLLAGHGGVEWRGLLETQAWQIINYFPQGLTARALNAARRGNLEDALSYNFLLALITAGTLALASAVLQRVYTEGGNTAAPERARSRDTAADAGTEGFSFFRGLPPPMRALVEKEFAYIRRDLYFRAMLIQFASFIVLGVTLARGQSQLPAEEGAIASLSGIGLMLTPAVRLVCNVFGTEGGAIALLFLTPCARRTMLMAKNLTWFLTLGVINSLYALLIAAISGHWLNLPLGCVGLADFTGGLSVAGQFRLDLRPVPSCNERLARPANVGVAGLCIYPAELRGDADGANPADSGCRRVLSAALLWKAGGTRPRHPTFRCCMPPPCTPVRFTARPACCRGAKNASARRWRWRRSEER